MGELGKSAVMPRRSFFGLAAQQRARGIAAIAAGLASIRIATTRHGSSARLRRSSTPLRLPRSQPQWAYRSQRAHVSGPELGCRTRGIGKPCAGLVRRKTLATLGQLSAAANLIGRSFCFLEASLMGNLARIVLSIGTSALFAGCGGSQQIAKRPRNYKGTRLQRPSPAPRRRSVRRGSFHATLSAYMTYYMSLTTTQTPSTSFLSRGRIRNRSAPLPTAWSSRGD